MKNVSLCQTVSNMVQAARSASGCQAGWSFRATGLRRPNGHPAIVPAQDKPGMPMAAP